MGVRQHRFELPDGSAELALIRHAESAELTEGTQWPTVDGRSDPDLSPVGERQAQWLVDKLVALDPQHFYVTPLKRTHQTLDPYLRAFDVEVGVEPDLIEVYHGVAENGLLRKYAADNDPIFQQLMASESWESIPGAESSSALKQRCVSAVQRMARRHAGERVAVVTHSGVIAAILSAATGSRPFAFLGMPNCSISRIGVLPDGTIRVLSFNQSSGPRDWS